MVVRLAVLLAECYSLLPQQLEVGCFGGEGQGEFDPSGSLHLPSLSRAHER